MVFWAHLACQLHCEPAIGGLQPPFAPAPYALMPLSALGSGKSPSLVLTGACYACTPVIGQFTQANFITTLRQASCRRPPCLQLQVQALPKNPACRQSRMRGLGALPKQGARLACEACLASMCRIAAFTRTERPSPHAGKHVPAGRPRMAHQAPAWPPPPAVATRLPPPRAHAAPPHLPLCSTTEIMRGALLALSYQVAVHCQGMQLPGAWLPHIRILQ